MLRPFKNEIMLMRKKGLSGPFLSKHANQKSTLSKSAGGFIEVGGAIPTEPPNLTGLFDILDGFEGDKYRVNLNSINTGGRATSWAWVGTPPPWANLSNAGYITGTATIGSWTGYAVTATNDLGSSTSNTDAVAITLQIPILSGLFNIQDGLVDDTYNIDLNSINTGGTAASWAWNGTPPAWASLDTATGIITGTATEGSWSGYSVTATNATGSDTSNTDSVAIILEPAAPVFSGVFDIVDGTEGDTVNYSVASLFANIPTSYAFTGGSPTGLSINNAGLITGTLQDGTWVGYAVTATNSLGSDTSNTDSITVASLAPVFSGVFNIPDGNVGDAVSYDVSGLFSNTPTSYNTNGAFPTGLSIDNAGLITGTLEEGTWVGYSVTATNSYGSDTSNTDSVNVVLSAGATFVGPYRALTSVQGVDTAGDICNILPRGTTPATSLHDATIYAPDYQGTYQSYAVDDPIWKNSRKVLNALKNSNDLTAAGWEAVANVTKTIVAGIGPNAEDVTQLDFVDDGGSFNYCTQTPVNNFGYGIYSIIARAVSGTAVFRFKAGDTYNSITLDETWTRYSFKFTKSYTNQVLGIYSDTASYTNMYVLGCQVENPVGRADDITPSEHVITGDAEGYETFAITNGNTIVDDKVIEGVGTALQPYLAATGSSTSDGLTPVSLIYTYPAANIPDPSNVVIGITLDYAGETNANVFDIGGLLTLKYIASQLTLSDGTNSVAVAITAGKRVIEITLTPTDMTLDVDGVTSTGSYTPVASGLIIVEEDHWALNAK